MRATVILFSFLLIVASDVPSHAVFALSEDDFCAAADDPCIIDQPFEVSSALVLDFGLRTVRIEGNGHLSGTVELHCGAFETDVASRWMDVTTAPETEEVNIVARRGCSADPAYPCLRTADCESAGLGICSVGDGGIRLGGDLVGVSPAVRLRASGDVNVNGRLVAAGSYPIADGGVLSIESMKGNIEIDGILNVTAGVDPEYFWPGSAGTVALKAFGDLILRNHIRAVGGRGTIDLKAGGDIMVGAAILAHAKEGRPRSGGSVAMTAGGDIRIQDAPGNGGTRINVHGGYDHQARSIEAAQGGAGTLVANGDIFVDENVRVNADSGRSRGDSDDLPFAGEWKFYAHGDLTINGRVSARGRGHYGWGRRMELLADGGITIGPEALLAKQSDHGTELTVQSYGRGPVAIHGQLNLRGVRREEDGELRGEGGNLSVVGGDVLVGGVTVSGGGQSGGSFFIDACRLRLTSTARIDVSLDEQENVGGDISIRVRESMLAEKGSRILSSPDYGTEIYYGDSAKPPVLLGRITPAPGLLTDPLLSPANCN